MYIFVDDENVKSYHYYYSITSGSLKLLVVYSLCSFLYLTFISFYILIYLYFIHLLILFIYLFICLFFYFYGWCDILTILLT